MQVTTLLRMIGFVVWMFFILLRKGKYFWRTFKGTNIGKQQSGSLSHSVMYLQLQGLLPARRLCPWDSPGKNTAVGCHSLVQRIFPIQGPNLDLLYHRQVLSCLCASREAANSKIKWLIFPQWRSCSFKNALCQEESIIQISILLAFQLKKNINRLLGKK